MFTSSYTRYSLFQPFRSRPFTWINFQRIYHSEISGGQDLLHRPSAVQNLAKICRFALDILKIFFGRAAGTTFENIIFLFWGSWCAQKLYPTLWSNGKADTFRKWQEHENLTRFTFLFFFFFFCFFFYFQEKSFAKVSRLLQRDWFASCEVSVFVTINPYLI